jgi:hypothetical protein
LKYAISTCRPASDSWSAALQAAASARNKKHAASDLIVPPKTLSLLVYRFVLNLMRRW